MRFKRICLYGFFVFCVFAFVNSIFAAPPKLKFTYWKVGQGEANAEPFITGTETTCTVEVRVGYEDEQSANAKPLNYYSWTVTMTHGFEFAGVSWQDGATGMNSTTFSWFGLGNGDAHQPQEHPHNGRPDEDEDGVLQHNVPMSVKIEFIGYYGPSNKCHVTISKTLTQDEIAQMRQEYVDHGITIPSRENCIPSNQYSNSDYGVMVDAGLAGYHAAWAAECGVPIAQMVVTSGYRNPEHHIHHVGATALRSQHQYGTALDVSTIN